MSRRTNYLKWNEVLNCVERQCIQCGEWWPNDDEFYHVNGQGYTYSRCKACEQERRQAVYREQKRVRNPLVSSTQAVRTATSVYVLDILIDLLVS